ncbi:MAG: metallopeptidase family protein [Phycisphaerales bacterium]|nr:metallopeptidase family protein [Phycisphaerales bacterium]
MKISRNKFDKLVEDAIASLPDEFAHWIDEVPIIVEDAPCRSDKDIQDALGFYQGPSLLGRLENSGHLPPRILLYRNLLMDACDSLDELAEEIRKTLLHELGHHAGMDEEQLDQLGYGSLDDDSIDWDVDGDSGP